MATTGTDELTRAQCLGLLAGRSVARVAYTDRALPAIAPVASAVVGADLVLRTRHAGLAARLDGQVVAVEVDDADGDEEHGWVVVVRGLARTVASDGHPEVRVGLDDVRGRRSAPGPLPPRLAALVAPVIGPLVAPQPVPPAVVLAVAPPPPEPSAPGPAR